jgi:hypothetical protein
MVPAGISPGVTRSRTETSMGDAIGQVLSPAIGVAISPLPLIAVILMLATPRGRVNGLAFTAGWVVSLAAAVTALVAVGAGGGANEDGSPARWVSWLKVGVGVLFLVLAVKQWRGRPAEDAEPQLPAWMRTIDTFTPVSSVCPGTKSIHHPAHT